MGGTLLFVPKLVLLSFRWQTYWNTLGCSLSPLLGLYRIVPYRRWVGTVGLVPCRLAAGSRVRLQLLVGEL